jgi:hypothetical protein
VEKKYSHKNTNILLPVVQSAVIDKVPVENKIRIFSRRTRLHPLTVDVSRNALIFCQEKMV